MWRPWAGQDIEAAGAVIGALATVTLRPAAEDAAASVAELLRLVDLMRRK